MAKRLKLTRVSSRCEAVKVQRRHADVPIGKVCKSLDGWHYSYVGGAELSKNFPGYGPIKSKQMAVRRVVKGYARWLGVSVRVAVSGDY